MTNAAPAKKDPVERFSNRVENYTKYRPHYPRKVLQLFKSKMGLKPESVVADIGSGTGISSKPFLVNGNITFGVEPNVNMRSAAEGYLAEFPNFRSIDGTSERTSLAENSVDLVVAAQAFHWFEPEATRREFLRILRPKGFAALIWNERQLDTTQFLKEYEAFLTKFANDYDTVRHENVGETKLNAFFGQRYETATFANFQVFDLEGLTGRVLSSSYMPSEQDDAYGAMIKELETLFAKHSENGKISVFYDTNVYYTQY